MILVIMPSFMLMVMLIEMIRMMAIVGNNMVMDNFNSSDHNLLLTAALTFYYF